MFNKRVLLVEDYEDSRAFMNLFLTMQGCKVLNAENGLQAIELATSEKPDLILMDLMMPVMDGYEATVLLRKADETKHIPIIIISAHLNSGDWRIKAKDSGADECLDKPLDVEILKRVLKEHISSNAI